MQHVCNLSESHCSQPQLDHDCCLLPGDLCNQFATYRQPVGDGNYLPSVTKCKKSYNHQFFTPVLYTSVYICHPPPPQPVAVSVYKVKAFLRSHKCAVISAGKMHPSLPEYLLFLWPLSSNQMFHHVLSACLRSLVEDQLH